MALSDSPFKRQFVQGLALQFARGLLWAWFGRLVAKGYLTSGQADYLIVGVVSFIVAVVVTVCSAVLRYVRSIALRNSPPDTDPKDINQLGWRILGQILSHYSSDILKG